MRIAAPKAPKPLPPRHSPWPSGGHTAHRRRPPFRRSELGRGQVTLGSRVKAVPSTSEALGRRSRNRIEYTILRPAPRRAVRCGSRRPHTLTLAVRLQNFHNAAARALAPSDTQGQAHQIQHQTSCLLKSLKLGSCQAQERAAGGGSGGAAEWRMAGVGRKQLCGARCRAGGPT